VVKSLNVGNVGGLIPPGATERAEARKGEFSLQYQWWRGQIVVRRGPSRTQWWLHIKIGDKVYSYALNSNPVDVAVTAGLLRTDLGEWMYHDGEVKPKTKFNPTKSTPCFARIEDKGTLDVFQDGLQFKKFKFSGKKLKGMWAFSKENGLWRVARSASIGEPRKEGGENMDDSFVLEAPVEAIKADDKSGKWIVEGFAATPDIDFQYERIAPEALEDAAVDLKERSTVLYNHDPNRPIGKVVESEARPEGLWVKVEISKTEGELWTKIMEGVINKFSFRASIPNPPEKFLAKEYDEEHKCYVTIIKKIIIKEISLVSVPANPKARTLRAYVEKGLEELVQKGYIKEWWIDPSKGGESMQKLSPEEFEKLKAEGKIKMYDELPEDTPQDESQDQEDDKEEPQKSEELPDESEESEAEKAEAEQDVEEDSEPEEFPEEIQKASKLEQIAWLCDKLLPKVSGKAKTIVQQIKAIATGEGYPKPYPYPQAGKYPEPKADQEAFISEVVSRVLAALKQTQNPEPEPEKAEPETQKSDKVEELEKKLAELEKKLEEEPVPQGKERQIKLSDDEAREFDNMTPSDRLRFVLKKMGVPETPAN